MTQDWAAESVGVYLKIQFKPTQISIQNIFALHANHRSIIGSSCAATGQSSAVCMSVPGKCSLACEEALGYGCAELSIQTPWPCVHGLRTAVNYCLNTDGACEEVIVHGTISYSSLFCEEFNNSTKNIIWN